MPPPHWQCLPPSFILSLRPRCMGCWWCCHVIPAWVAYKKLYATICGEGLVAKTFTNSCADSDANSCTTMSCGSSWWLSSPPVRVMSCHSFLVAHQQCKNMVHNSWPTIVAILVVGDHFHIGCHSLFSSCQPTTVSYAFSSLSHYNHVCKCNVKVSVEVNGNNEATCVTSMYCQPIVATMVIMSHGRMSQKNDLNVCLQISSYPCHVYSVHCLLYCMYLRSLWINLGDVICYWTTQL